MESNRLCRRRGYFGGKPFGALPGQRAGGDHRDQWKREQYDEIGHGKSVRKEARHDDRWRNGLTLAGRRLPV